MFRAKGSPSRGARAAIAVLAAFTTIVLIPPVLSASAGALDDVNLVENPGFEVDTSGWNKAGVADVTLARVAGGHSGSWEAELTNTGATPQRCALNDSPDWVKPAFAATYTATMWVRADAAGQTFTLRIREFAGGPRVGFETVTTPLTTEWQEVSVAYVPVSPGTSHLDLQGYVKGAAPGHCFDADDVSITKTHSPPGMPDECSTPTITGSGVVLGTPGDDVIVTEPGDVTVRGLGGNDVICTGNGDDVIVTLGGDDLVYSSGGMNVVTTRAGNDQVFTRGGPDTIRTGGGQDVIRAGKGKNVINAGGGRDEVVTGKGPDRIRAGGGNDVVRAGHGRNRVWGGGGRDLLVTGKGRDRLNGGPGVDTCRSGRGQDVVLNCERR